MSSEQEFKCVFCSETFTQKEDLQIHFRKHGDPNFKQKKPRGRSQEESDVSAEKLKDQAEVVECDVCAEVFSTISKAITHKHKVHPDHDSKYFCPWCGKLFTMKHLYNKHMQASHLDMEKSGDRLFHCDTCDVDFNIAAAISYHNKFYHRQDELPTIGHSKKLKMILEEVIQIYYCPFCGEEYDNKVNLHKHMTDDHCGENQSPEDVFRCPLCDAIFNYLDAYELHLTYHSNEDLYTERNDMMDEITDFSLETVQPLQEKVESAEPLHEEEPKAIGIEQLLEFTMDDTPDTRKHKKHKKHKKSKKAAITLDEFLNMNKDVFGEGIDFEGVEEVPTQVVKKRLKTKKAVPASKFISSDLAKLKRQGIVVKKQPTKTGKPIIMKKEAIKVPNTVMKTQKNINVMPQKNSNTLTSTDDVLSKLLNQGSQIKIVKKSNQDSEEHIQQEQDNAAEERLSPKNIEANDEEGRDQLSNASETEERNQEVSGENIDSNNTTKIISTKPNSLAASPIPGSPSTIDDINDLKASQNSNENSNNSAHFNDDTEKCPDQFEKSKNLTENLIALRRNSNIAIKSSKQNTSDTKSPDNNTIEDVGTAQIKERDVQDDTERKSTVSEKSSLNALKHLSHLITIKPVTATQTAPLSDVNKPENGLQKVELVTSSYVSQNSLKTPDKMSLTNMKKLGSITIKPQSSLMAPKNNTSVETTDNIDDNHETDDEWDEDTSIRNVTKVDKIAQMLKSPQLSVQTKLSPKTIQKESPKVTSNNDNSQSSADLLKHLKNVTAKPVNVNSPKVQTPKSSPSTIKRSSKPTVQKEVTDEGIEIFSIDDSDSDDANCNTTSQDTIKTESKIETIKSIDALKNINKNITIKSTNQQCKTVKDAVRHSNKPIDDDAHDWGDDADEKETYVKKNSSPKPNQKHVAINNVLKNLSKNITVKSRNSSPSQPVQSPDHNSRDSHLEDNEADSDSDTPLSRVKITEMENSDDEIPETAENISHGNVTIQHPDDSHSEHEDDPMDEEFDMSDIESHIATAKIQKDKLKLNSSIDGLKNLNKGLTIKSTNNKASLNNIAENSLPSEEIPQFAKNLSNQISIKQIKKPESNQNAKVIEQTATHSMNQSSLNKKMATSSNQLNTFNKEVKTVKTFQTQTQTVIQEITTTVTKTIKTVNQTTKQEVRNMAQSSSTPMIQQKVQGMNPMFSQKNFQGVKVRQAPPNIRPKIRGQAPQSIRPAICAPPQGSRPIICPPPRASNQLVPVRPALNRPTGPRPRTPKVMNMRPSTSGQQRPQIGKPVKVSPGAIFSSPQKPAEVTGHFSCFKKPKESLIPVPDFPQMNKVDGESSVPFSSAMQMSKSNFSSITKTVKGNSVVSSTQMKSEMSASSQQLSRLRNMSGLSVVKTSQSHAKQTQVEEKSEMSASKRNALEAIQKLQSQGLLVKKPRLDVSEDSDHSQPGSDDMEHNSNENFYE